MVCLSAMRGRRSWQWDVFEETAPRRLYDKLYATLNRYGHFTISLKTHIQMNEPEAVILLYDKETRTIGVRPSRLSVSNAITIHVRYARYNRVFRSKKFLVKHNIKIDQTIQFPTAEIDTDGVLILNLKESVLATHMPRSNSKTNR